MTSRRWPLRRALAFAGVLFVLHAGGARALVAFGAADRLLATGGTSVGLVAALVAFFVVRLLLYFLAPGLLLGALWTSFARRKRPVGLDGPGGDA